MMFQARVLEEENRVTGMVAEGGVNDVGVSLK